jgi:hypothetical protein
VRDPAQVAAAVAAALGIRELPSVAAADALAHALAGRQLLLVLDNCEHMIGAAAELCGRLLLGANDVRVLATSREPLQIGGEARYRLGPLSLPDPDDPAAADGSEAMALFADRARRAHPSFTRGRAIRVRGGHRRLRPPARPTAASQLDGRERGEHRRIQRGPSALAGLRACTAGDEPAGGIHRVRAGEVLRGVAHGVVIHGRQVDRHGIARLGILRDGRCARVRVAG